MDAYDLPQLLLSVLMPPYPCPAEERVGAWGDGGKERVGAWGDGGKVSEWLGWVLWVTPSCSLLFSPPLLPSTAPLLCPPPLLLFVLVPGRGASGRVGGWRKAEERVGAWGGGGKVRGAWGGGEGKMGGRDSGKVSRRRMRLEEKAL
ncbi:unnamed protein product [Closterium sp. Naga37s-1]|nr:unnamed protein product [Closterium sp. Naga37s-1]